MILASAASSAFAQAQDDSVQAQLDAMKAKIAQMQATMNSNAASPSLPSDNWFNRISVSGLLNVDGNIANRAPTTYGANNNTQTASSFAIPNANIFIDADVSDWTKAHVGLVYGQQMGDFNLLRAGAYTYSQQNSDTSGVNIDEAYVTIGNFAKSPFYLKAGQQFLPFGDYKPYQDITPSLTQVLSQVNDVAATTGFVSPKGFNGSVFALSGINKASGASTTASNANTVRNYGASLGFANSVKDVQYKLGVQYLRNMADVTGVRYSLGNTNIGNNDTYISPVSAIAANADVKFKAIDLNMKYVGAMNSFNQSDVAYTNGADTVQGASPKAWTVDTGYSFPVLNHDTRFGLGYQGTSQAGNLVLSQDDAQLPQHRYLANYTFNVSKYTDIGLEVRHDIAYSVNQGGTGNSANTATARVAVKFA